MGRPKSLQQPQSALRDIALPKNQARDHVLTEKELGSGPIDSLGATVSLQEWLMSMIWPSLERKRPSVALFPGFLGRFALLLDAARRIIVRGAWDSPKTSQIASFQASNRQIMQKRLLEDARNR